MSRRIPACLLLVSFLVAGCAVAQDVAPTAAEVLARVRSTWEGESLHAVVRLEITSAGATRIHVVEVWTLGDEFALLRVLEPTAEKGSGYLQVGDELWYHAPAAGSAIKLPSMLLGDALFGAGPSLSDLALDTLAEDFDATLESAPGGYMLTLVPHPDAPVVYGQMDLAVSAAYVIERLVTYDQRGDVLRTATFSDVVDLGGQKLPTRIVVEDASGDRTVQEIVNPESGADLDASFFTIERLEGTR